MWVAKGLGTQVGDSYFQADGRQCIAWDPDETGLVVEPFVEYANMDFVDELEGIHSLNRLDEVKRDRIDEPLFEPPCIPITLLCNRTSSSKADCIVPI